jgi:hypothetical protein
MDDMATGDDFVGVGVERVDLTEDKEDTDDEGLEGEGDDDEAALDLVFWAGPITCGNN